MKDLKVLRTYGTQFEAELVKNKLAREGIIATIDSHDAAGMFPSVDYADGVRLCVEPDDLTEAMKIVDHADVTAADIENAADEDAIDE